MSKELTELDYQMFVSNIVRSCQGIETVILNYKSIFGLNVFLVYIKEYTENLEDYKF